MVCRGVNRLVWSPRVQQVANYGEGTWKRLWQQEEGLMDADMVAARVVVAHVEDMNGSCCVARLGPRGAGAGAMA